MGPPLHTLKGKNVFLIHGFKDYCALLFHKGALLKDDHGIPVQQTANVQAARQIRFTGVGEITELAAVLRSYMQDAILNEEAGKHVALKKTAAFEVHEEFAAKPKAVPALKRAFHALQNLRRVCRAFDNDPAAMKITYRTGRPANRRGCGGHTVPGVRDRRHRTGSWKSRKPMRRIPSLISPASAEIGRTKPCRRIGACHVGLRQTLRQDHHGPATALTDPSAPSPWTRSAGWPRGGRPYGPRCRSCR